MFKKAIKEGSKIKLAIFGPSGAGKTYSALSIATGITSITGGKIAVIDSERGTARKYADRFDFDVAELEDYSIASYIQNIESANMYDVLIIDSLTHGWQYLVREVDKLAQAKYRGNTWAAWNEGTPLQKKLVSSFYSFNGHIIATMRSRTEWTVDKDRSGQTRPVRVGLAPEQGKGIEFEFDMLLELSTSHIGNVIKDRTGSPFQDVIIEKPGVDFGKELFNLVCKDNTDQTEWEKYTFQKGKFEGKKVSEVVDLEYLTTISNQSSTPDGLKDICSARVVALRKSWIQIEKNLEVEK